LKVTVSLHAGAALDLRAAGSGDRRATSKKLTRDVAWAGEMQAINAAVSRQGARAMNRLMIAAVLLLLPSAGSHDQLAGGALSGVVMDQQCGVLPLAVVVVMSSDRSVEFMADEAGRFRFLNLAPGDYRLSIEHPGFSGFVLEAISVRVGATADVAVRMTLAGVAETVSVGATVADTHMTGTATNFTTSDLEQIPTSRDLFASIRTVPGVLLDRVNIAGNETGQQSGVESKGTRASDTVWTLDDVVVADLASAGASPIYYDFDSFEEIQLATAGQDIKQPTGGLGVNLVVRRGTNNFHGLVHGYFTGEGLEASNLPDELRAAGVTSADADHNQQIADYGFNLGGPLVRNRLWFHASYSAQDVRLVRRGLIDRTRIKSPNVKVNWQATEQDRVSFLYFDGDKLKDGRTPSGAASILFPAATALQNQHNTYAGDPFHGLWKIEDNHSFGSALFATATAAYFNTGFQLEPAGGPNLTSGRSTRLSRSFGSVSQRWNLRPQWNVNADATTFQNLGESAHDVRVGGGWRRVDAKSGTLWPGNGFLAFDNSLTDRRVRVCREGRGTNRVEMLHL
jgi:hypothetical protein